MSLSEINIICCPNKNCNSLFTISTETLLRSPLVICTVCAVKFDAKHNLAYQAKELFSPKNQQQPQLQPLTSELVESDDSFPQSKPNIPYATNPEQHQRTIFKDESIPTKEVNRKNVLLYCAITISIILIAAIFHWLKQPFADSGHSRFDCLLTPCINNSNVDLTLYYDITGVLQLDPTMPSTLIATVELYNNHSISLPLPNVIIYFKNDAGLIVAAREFSAKDFFNTLSLQQSTVNAKQRISLVLRFKRPQVQLDQYQLAISNPK